MPGLARGGERTGELTRSRSEINNLRTMLTAKNPPGALGTIHAGQGLTHARVSSAT